MTLALEAPTRHLPAAGHAVPDPAVRLERLTKRFRLRRRWTEVVRRPGAVRHVQVIDGVSLSVATGEFFGILGPNGAGKTTLFRMLSASLLPDGGSARILGHDVEREPTTVRRLVGSALADERTLHWRLTAQENLRMFAALHGMRTADALRRIREVLDVVELGGTGRKMVATFSSGMKQRLLIARALLSRPHVLLLDEPTRSLDPIVARDFRRFLRERLVMGEGCTILLATHSGEEAMALCDRVAILDKGRVLAVGTPDSIGGAVGDRRFAAWTRAPEHPAFERLRAQGIVGEIARGEADEEGWTPVRMAIPGSTESAARVLDILHCAGVEVARFERESLPLADLIERVVRRSASGAP